MQVQEKVQILAAIHASQLAIAEKTIHLWAAGVLNPDATIITWAATSSSEEPGTSTGGNSPRVPGPHGGSGMTTFPDHPGLSAPTESASQTAS